MKFIFIVSFLAVLLGFIFCRSATKLVPDKSQDLSSKNYEWLQDWENRLSWRNASDSIPDKINIDDIIYKYDKRTGLCFAFWNDNFVNVPCAGVLGMRK